MFTCPVDESSTYTRVATRSRPKSAKMKGVTVEVGLTLAGLLPAKEYTLRVKYAGERPRKVGLDEKVDLRRSGVEKFKALPRDQTDG